MSLVSEALKKAEREAAARDARAKGQPAPFEAPLQPYRSRRSGGARTPIFAALGAAALLVALALLWWSGGREAPATGAAASATAATAAANVTPVAESAAAQPRSGDPALPSPSLPPNLPATPPPAAPSVSEPATTILATSPFPRTAREAPPSPPGASEPAKPKAPAPRAPSAPTSVTTFGPGDYLLRVDFPDGSKLELGGIVYSETSPFAYLNGRLVGVGEFVEGRRIDRIERDRVILSGDGGTLSLRLKAP